MGLVAVLPPSVEAQRTPTQPIPGTLVNYWAHSTLLETPGLLRANRVEGVSVAGAVDFAIVGWAGRATARIGWADRRPNAWIELRRLRGTTEFTVSATKGLASTQPFAQPFGFGNSLGALLFGRDLGEYMRVEGLQVGLRDRRGRWSVAAKAERQKPASINRVWSLSNVDGPAGIERALRAVSSVRTLGVEADLRLAWGSDPWKPQTRLWAEAVAEGGSFAFVGLALRNSTVLPLANGTTRRARPRFSITLTPEVGASSGGAPPQRRRSLGGAWTIRGWEPGTLSGRTWATGRAQVDWHAPFADLGPWVDVAWVGGQGEPLTDSAAPPTTARSVGFGAGFLDGTLRVDLAVPLVEGGGVGVEVWLLRRP